MTNASDEQVPQSNPFSDITDCMVHSSGVYEDDCEFCVAEATAKQQRLTDFQQQVGMRVEGLAKDGGGQPDPAMLAHMRLSILLDALLTPRNRIHFEMEYLSQLQNVVNQATTNHARQKLLQGVQQAPPNLRDLNAKQQFKKHGKR